MFFPESRMQWLGFFVLAFIAVSLLFYGGRSIRNLQYRLLYYPSSTAPPDSFYRTRKMEPWGKSEMDYRGLVSLIEPKSSKGTIIVFHGNGGTAADRTFYPDVLGGLGYRVVLAEYPMYGGRKGELGEKAFVSDAVESTVLAFKDFGGPFFILGESMGCGIAAAVAREAPVHIDGVILITPWETLAAIAKEKFPFLPVRLLLSDEYDTIKNLESFRGRIAIIGAEQDEVIPIGHARKLYESLPAPAKKMWVFQEAGHNDWYVFANNKWWQEVMAFISGGG